MESFKSIVSNKILVRRSTQPQPVKKDKWDFLQVEQLNSKSKFKPTEYESPKLTNKSRSKSIAYPTHKNSKKDSYRKKNSTLATIDTNPDETNNEIENFTTLSITDFCKKPRTHRFSSNLSMEAKLALIKTYEDMIFYEFLVHTPLDVSQIPYQIEVAINTEKNRQMAEEANSRTSRYQREISSKYNRENSWENSRYKRENTEVDEYEVKHEKKLRFSHFVESAQMILDKIQRYKRETIHVGKSEINLNEIENMFKKWIYLCNKESLLWNKECHPFIRF